jgi:hypothetical protein
MGVNLRMTCSKDGVSTPVACVKARQRAHAAASKRGYNGYLGLSLSYLTNPNIIYYGIPSLPFGGTLLVL